MKHGLYIILSFLLVLTACSSTERPKANKVDRFMGKLGTHIDLCDKAYMDFLNKLPEKHKFMTKSHVMTQYDNMLHHLKQERRRIQRVKTFKGDEETRRWSEELKQAAIDIVDNYIVGAKTEILDVRDLIRRGKTVDSPEVQKKLDLFSGRVYPKYDKYGDIQEKLAEAYDITLN